MKFCIYHISQTAILKMAASWSWPTLLGGVWELNFLLTPKDAKTTTEPEYLICNVQLNAAGTNMRFHAIFSFLWRPSWIFDQKCNVK